MESIIRRSARAIVIDDRARLVLLKRTRPGAEPYWTTPGGGVEAEDASVEAALVRELREELGAEVAALQQVLLASAPVSAGEMEVQHFFVCRLQNIDLGRRTGPEFNDSARGSYLVDRIALTGDDLGGLGLKPDELRAFIRANRAALLDEVAVQVE